MTVRRHRPAAASEAGAVAMVGGVLAAPFGVLAGRFLADLFGADGWATPTAVVAAVVGVLNGAISGWRGVYEWSSVRGYVAFVLDSTWSLPMTLAGVFAHGAGAIRGAPGFAAELSVRQNRHVYARGFAPRPGYLVTLGNTINGAGDTSTSRKQRLITDHEDVHVWQSRWFGPLYPLLYVGWMLLAGAAGALLWLVRRPVPTTSKGTVGKDTAKKGTVGKKGSLFKTMESLGYHTNPFEWWAYSRDDNWPPRGKLPGLGWRRPMVRSLAASRAAAAARRAGRATGTSSQR